MAFLKGSSDITNLRADLYALLTGTMAAGSRGGGQAGNGAQVAGTDAWTALDGMNFVVRSKREESPFSGEYGLYRGCPRFGAASTSTAFQSSIQTMIGKPTFSGAYSGVDARVYFVAYVSTTNSAPGNLSGTVVTFRLINADTGAVIAGPTTVSGWSGSSDTRALGATGVSLTLTLGGSDQFIAGNPGNTILWIRAYTTTFTQGIDYFPEAAKVTAAGITVSNTSGGPNNYTGGGTDYTLVQQVHAFPGVSATVGYGQRADTEWGGTGAGCGIAWNAGGSPPAVGANYFIPAAYTVYGAYFQVPNVVSISSNFALTGGPMDVWDATLQVGRFVRNANGPTVSPQTSLNTTVSTGQLFVGAAQAGSTFINFWISVKSDKIVIVLRGDPGQNGRIVVQTLQRLANPQATDKWPWLYLFDGGAFAATSGGCQHVSSTFQYAQPYYGVPSQAMGNISQPMWFGGGNGATAGRVVTTGIGPTAGVQTPTQNPNNWDLRWWLYSLYVFRNRGGSNLVGTFDETKQTGISGTLQGIYSLSADNWSNLDELVDNSGTYLLVTPTSSWGQTNTYTSLAIREE